MMDYISEIKLIPSLITSILTLVILFPIQDYWKNTLKPRFLGRGLPSVTGKWEQFHESNDAFTLVIKEQNGHELIGAFDIKITDDETSKIYTYQYEVKGHFWANMIALTLTHKTSDNKRLDCGCVLLELSLTMSGNTLDGRYIYKNTNEKLKQKIGVTSLNLKFNQ
jgi:hypothetical protein